MYWPTIDYIYYPKGETKEEKDLDTERRAKELDRGHGYETYRIDFWTRNISVYL